MLYSEATWSRPKPTEQELSKNQWNNFCAQTFTTSTSEKTSITCKNKGHTLQIQQGWVWTHGKVLVYASLDSQSDTRPPSEVFRSEYVAMRTITRLVKEGKRSWNQIQWSYTTRRDEGCWTVHHPCRARRSFSNKRQRHKGAGQLSCTSSTHSWTAMTSWGWEEDGHKQPSIPMSNTQLSSQNDIMCLDCWWSSFMRRSTIRVIVWPSMKPIPMGSGSWDAAVRCYHSSSNALNAEKSGVIKNKNGLPSPREDRSYSSGYLQRYGLLRTISC